MNAVTDGLSSLVYGFASAFVPILNAEAYVGLFAALAPLSLLVVVLAVGCGQTVGKVLLFEAARRGKRLVRERAGPPRRHGSIATWLRTWRAQLMRLLDDRRGGAATVLVSASVGVPPLAAVSLAAGTSSQRRLVFAVCCLAGRVVRFGILAAPLAYAAR